MCIYKCKFEKPCELNGRLVYVIIIIIITQPDNGIPERKEDASGRHDCALPLLYMYIYTYMYLNLYLYLKEIVKEEELD